MGAGQPHGWVVSWSDSVCDDDTCTVSVNEVRCAEPGCPDVETVIAIFRPATAPRRLRILKPVSAVKREDLEALS